MPAGGGNDQRFDRRGVPADVREIAQLVQLQAWERASRDPAPPRRAAPPATEVRSPAPPDEDRLDDRRLVDALPRHDHALQAGPQHALRHRQRPVAGPDLAVEPELAEHREALQRLRRHLVARGQDAARDRQVEPRALLAQVGRGEVHGDAVLREREARVEDRAADALARLAHRAVPEADDRERREPLANVDLDGHAARFDAVDGERGDVGEHGAGR